MLCWSSLLYSVTGVSDSLIRPSFIQLTTFQSKLFSYLGNKEKSKWAGKGRSPPDESRKHRKPLDLWSKASEKKTLFSSRSNPERGPHCTPARRTCRHTPSAGAPGSRLTPSGSSLCNTLLFLRAACSFSPFLSVLSTRRNRTTAWALSQPSWQVQSQWNVSLLGLIASWPPWMTSAPHGPVEADAWCPASGIKDL